MSDERDKELLLEFWKYLSTPVPMEAPPRSIDAFLASRPKMVAARSGDLLCHINGLEVRATKDATYYVKDGEFVHEMDAYPITVPTATMKLEGARGPDGPWVPLQNPLLP